MTRALPSLPILLLVACSTPTPVLTEPTVIEATEVDLAPAPTVEPAPARTREEVARAAQVEKAIRGTGESRPLAGQDGGTFPGALAIVEEDEDGTLLPMCRPMEMVHVVAGTAQTGIERYRVGFVADEPCIVLRATRDSRVYEVLWESWPNGACRAGDPLSDTITFDH
jgi:hypothetical protein